MSRRVVRSLCVLVLLIMFVSVSWAAELIDINSASAAQLMAVKGIGPKTAQSIVDYRTQHGTFKNLAEMMNVKGIGEKTLQKISGQLTVAEPEKVVAPQQGQQ